MDEILCNLISTTLISVYLWETMISGNTPLAKTASLVETDTNSYALIEIVWIKVVEP
jgi:hypothetical protein